MFRSARHPLTVCVLATVLLLGGPVARAATPVATADEWLPAAAWRLVGPFRGGWSTMAVGVPTAPDTYYSAAAGGGLWRTDDSGRTWVPLTDGQPITGIGAVAVAPSDPRVLYIGTGQPEPRYDIVAGSGVYRSVDAGHTWSPAGLAATRHIGALLVDRRDAKVVLVAALGHVFGPNPERGVYRTDDGGRTWQQTLYVDATTGAMDLAVDPENPDLVYAATWTARVWPWLSYFTKVEGAGSAIWRSNDAGRHWQKLSGAGWPEGSLGRIGLAVTHAAGATRVYASVDSAVHGGLYRSDDGGDHWTRVNDASWVTSWYMSRLTVSPTDPDTVYTVGQSIHESKDAGRTFSIVRGAPGGDDYHYLWINPKDPARRVLAGDQGTIVSVNGGSTWGDWYNQPTGQFYYLATDERFPYWIYSGQQDSGTAAVVSRSNTGSLSLRDWHPLGGEERDYEVPDPDNPSIVFGTGLGGRIVRWDETTGEAANVTPWPVVSYGMRATDYRYHYNWFTPITFGRAAPHALYAGAQVLFRSLDRGTHWEVISPDLSAHDATQADCGGDPDPARALACGYGAINAIATSARDAAELWVGTDDGLLWLTRDGGKAWVKVTPPGVPAWAKLSSIDLLTDRPGSAYVAVDNHRQDDVSPYAYRTEDYGRTWVAIGGGLAPGHYVSVVRADPVCAGLLYAGTDIGVSVSFDDGAHWQSLSQNLPPAWVHDLVVHDRDLVAATVGRAIWVLDDLGSLRQHGRAASAGPRLYTPSPAYRLRVNQNHAETPFPIETALGQNPPTGAIIDYLLPQAARGPVELDIRDSAGVLVRHYSSASPGETLASERYFTADWMPRPIALSGAPGAHRVVWNLRYPRPRAIQYEFSIAISPAEGTSLTPDGPLVLPGRYTVQLRVDGQTREAPLTVLADPRVHATQAELAAALAFSRALEVDLGRAWRGYAEIGALREVMAARARVPAAAGAREALTALETALQSILSGGSETDPNLAAAAGVLAAIATDVAAADRAPTDAQREAARLSGARIDTALARFAAVRKSEWLAANRRLAALGQAPLVVPPAAQLHAAEPPQGQDLP